MLAAVMSFLGAVIGALPLMITFWGDKHKEKLSRQREDLHNAQLDALEYVNLMLEYIGNINLGKEVSSDTEDKLNKNRKKIKETVFACGSSDAIKLVEYIDYSLYNKKVDSGDQRIITAYIMLTLQLKYDLTGIKVSPEAWYIGEFIGYSTLEFYEQSKEISKEIVKVLKLKRFLKINDKFMFKKLKENEIKNEK